VPTAIPAPNSFNCRFHLLTLKATVLSPSNSPASKFYQQTMYKTYILTIQRNIDRAKKILSGIPNSEIVIGLDAKKEEDKTIITQVRSKTKSETMLSDGEVACTLGHKTILEKFLKTNDSYCVVLEDDAEATPLALYLQQDLPEIFDENNQAMIFVLGGQEGLNSYKYIDWKSPFKILNSGTVYDLTASSRFLYRTCCYGIDRVAAQQLIEYYQNNLIVADDYFRIVNNTGVRVLLKKQAYYSHPVGGPSELASGGRSIGNRTKSNRLVKACGVVLIFLYNNIKPIKPSFYNWIVRRLILRKKGL
jgi:glycosyl transferase family 25